MMSTRGKQEQFNDAGSTAAEIMEIMQMQRGFFQPRHKVEQMTKVLHGKKMMFDLLPLTES